MAVKKLHDFASVVLDRAVHIARTSKCINIRNIWTWFTSTKSSICAYQSRTINIRISWQLQYKMPSKYQQAPAGMHIDIWSHLLLQLCLLSLEKGIQITCVSGNLYKFISFLLVICTFLSAESSWKLGLHAMPYYIKLVFSLRNHWLVVWINSNVADQGKNVGVSSIWAIACQVYSSFWGISLYFHLKIEIRVYTLHNEPQIFC